MSKCRTLCPRSISSQWRCDTHAMQDQRDPHCSLAQIACHVWVQRSKILSTLGKTELWRLEPKVDSILSETGTWQRPSRVLIAAGAPPSAAARVCQGLNLRFGPMPPNWIFSEDGTLIAHSWIFTVAKLSSAKLHIGRKHLVWVVHFSCYNIAIKINPTHWSHVGTILHKTML